MVVEKRQTNDVVRQPVFDSLELDEGLFERPHRGTGAKVSPESPGFVPAAPRSHSSWSANHASHFDALCLISSLPLRRVHRAFPAAAADYFFSSLPRSMVSVVFVNGLPFDRKSEGAESLEVCRQLLARPGNILIICPEGSRSTTGAVGRFRSGIATLVAGTTTPVLPCYLSGAHEAWPKGALLPRSRALRPDIGCPRVFADVSPADREAAQAICAQLRDDVVALASGS
jgi:1-acyl-sn-glycerol-3-phosphate acyltransferase